MGQDFSSLFLSSAMGNNNTFNNIYNPQVYQNDYMSNDIGNIFMPQSSSITPDSLFGYGNMSMKDFQSSGVAQNFDLASISNFNDSFMLFNMLFNGGLSPDVTNNLFNQNFNTQNNLGALQNVYNQDLGNKLANIANKVANQTNTVGYCAAGVVDALEEANLTQSGEARAGAAYEVAPKLRNSANFKEVSVSREDLQNLPAGCVVVWDASEGHQYGHITVTLGRDEQGTPKEASDHVEDLITNRNASFSVFAPVASNG